MAPTCKTKVGSSTLVPEGVEFCTKYSGEVYCRMWLTAYFGDYFLKYFKTIGFNHPCYRIQRVGVFFMGCANNRIRLYEGLNPLNSSAIIETICPSHLMRPAVNHKRRYTSQGNTMTINYLTSQAAAVPFQAAIGFSYGTLQSFSAVYGLFLVFFISYETNQNTFKSLLKTLLIEPCGKPCEQIKHWLERDNLNAGSHEERMYD